LQIKTPLKGEDEMKIEFDEDLYNQIIQHKNKEWIKEPLSLLEKYRNQLDRELYINDPVYHHITSSQMNAIVAGRKDWFLFGHLPLGSGKMKLDEATDEELRAECKKRGWAMVRPIKIEFDADYILDKE